jgi:hypothetical protein
MQTQHFCRKRIPTDAALKFGKRVLILHANMHFAKKIVPAFQLFSFCLVHAIVSDEYSETK